MDIDAPLAETRDIVQHCWAVHGGTFEEFWDWWTRTFFGLIVAFRRLQVYRSLVKARVPGHLAMFLANRWPQRFLPKLDPVQWGAEGRKVKLCSS